jgi:ABC-type transport system involved in cytochrome c biogenesis permease subunit
MPTLAFILLAAAAVIEIIYLFIKKKSVDPISPWLLLAASLLLLAELARRSLEIRFIALTGTFESLLFFSALIALLTFAYRMQKKVPYYPLVLFGGTMLALIFLAVASSPIAPTEVKPPIPALQSGWLVLHVSFAFIGEAFFALSFVSAILFLIARDNDRKKTLDRITYTSVAVGYPIYTAGALIFGAIWAEQAWGRYWSWDPKETWALVTWLVYTIYLHLRFIRKNTSALPAVVVIVGFIVTIFTFLGVNFLLPGLHSY